jgi:hypothetical protein
MIAVLIAVSQNAPRVLSSISKSQLVSKVLEELFIATQM